MKKGSILAVLLLNSLWLFAQNEVGPEGHKLLWVLLFLAAITVAFIVSGRSYMKKSKTERRPFFQLKRLSIKLEKDALFYPDKLILTVINNGSTAIDLDQPLLVFDNFWLKRKFKLKGMDNYNFYPLYLEGGKSHQLKIDLNRFYSHDKSLKKYPKAKIYMKDIKGKKLGHKAVFLRKTLVKF
ncbi:hypothetical protein [Draconibacterium halophilum]|uniref:DUF58 domain-containing protein n=1 Tax=Draconibacterium halophilum TaxID=2706887 RepID=A0A6C0R8D2_9BACT|nr:hypothetical protein [Draconibacterium halophilum]QIA06297.1 hypothetical protein G0Q07_00465 [Draconibacterium halophilum]